MANDKKTDKSGVFKEVTFFIVLALCIAFSLSFIISRANNILPSVFGFSTVKILSPSMEQSGFNIGDVAVIKKTKTHNLENGEIIAFYHFSDPFNPAPNVGTPSANALELARERKSEVWFHEIVERVVDNTGMAWYKTKGTSNLYPDAGFIRSDLVLGKNFYVPKIVSSLLSFFSSTMGVLLLVLLPNVILLIFLSFELFKGIEKLLYQQKIIKGKIHIATAVNERRDLVFALTKGQRKKIKLNLTKHEQNKFSEYLT